MTVPARSELQGITSYRPGLRPTDLTGSDGLATIVKLSSNESAFPPLPTVVEAVRSIAGEVQLYADVAARGLGEALARQLHLEPSQSVVDAGSVAVYRAVVDAFVGRDEEVVIADQTFDVYARYVTIVGGRPVIVPLDATMTHDLDAMLAAVTSRTRMVVVCNPNNPTGTDVAPERLRSFVDAVPEDVLVVVDEAYHEFADGGVASRGAIELVGDHDNVIVLRTFSKAYGLAGLRVGYAAAPSSIVGALNKVMIPFAVSSVAQVAAMASLSCRGELGVVSCTIEERSRVTKALRDMGISVADSAGNFVWLPVGSATGELTNFCAGEGVIVRPLQGGVRVTTASPGENDRFVLAMKKWSER